ncbi:hypothetical protein L3X38_024914 [Prunus dulcis]|uniref:Uncharacterized protein n=1 Tax=Prunus dulcis TaxID=3755 RepID=A0AAD4W1I8_PRUDU|nr:hypothetical protein L3X38_024914 [Prunus dulcis]
MRSYNYNVYDEPIKATSESAEWIFLATNLGLEMLSAACDQVPPQENPIMHYLYVYCLRHANNPFKASLLPAIFLLCLGGSKLSNNRRNANTADNILRKPLDGKNKKKMEKKRNFVGLSIRGYTRGAVVGGWEVLADDGHVGGGWDEVMAEQQQRV